MNLNELWEKMKRTENIIVQTKGEVELLKDLNGKFFYVKCKAGDLQKLKC